MRIGVIGTGFIGGILGRALANAGNEVVFGSRHPDDKDVLQGSSASVASVDEALDGANVVILALPGLAVAEFAQSHKDGLSAKLVIDATNRVGEPVTNSRAELPSNVRYSRAFNTLAGENMANPIFDDGPLDMFFSAPEADRSTVETIIEEVGLHPVYVGADEEATIDGVFGLWLALAIKQEHGRLIALRLLVPRARS